MLSAYPAITKAEFYAAAQVLQSAYTSSQQVTNWIDFRCSSSEISIRQRRSTSYSSIIPKSLVTTDEKCEAVEEFEAEDKEVLCRTSHEAIQHLLVDFSIVLSETYQVPVLWFSSPSVPATRADALDQVYETIVSPASRTELRQIGVLGGISIAEHPNSGLPAFFVHPCMTQEALEVVHVDNNILPIDYLLLWFGIIGGPVGLSVPSLVAESVAIPRDGKVEYIA